MLTHGGKRGIHGLRMNQTYVAFRNHPDGVQPVVRNPPEPPLTLSPLPTFSDAQRLVYGVWRDAVRIAIERIDDPVTPFPEIVRSLRGKINANHLTRKR